MDSVLGASERQSSPDRQPLYLTPNLHFWGRAAAHIAAWLAGQRVDAADACVLLPQAVHQGLLRTAWLQRGCGARVLPQTTTLAALRELAALAAGIELPDSELQALDWAQQLLADGRFGPALAAPQRLPARLALSREILQLRAQLLARADHPQQLRDALTDSADADADNSWRIDAAARGLADDPAWRVRDALFELLRRQARVLVLVDDGDPDPAVQSLLRRWREAGRPALQLRTRLGHGLGAALLATAGGQRWPRPRRASALLAARARWLAGDDLETQARAVLDAVLAERARDPHARIAIVAVDRRLSRRVNALLNRLALPVLDEAGWLLSTTGAAAALPLLLALAQPDPDTDSVLDWLKQPGVAAAAGLDDAALIAIERDLRRHGLHQLGSWHAWAGSSAQSHAAALRHLQHSREPWSRPAATVADHTGALLDVARRSGLLDCWQADAAGRQLLQWLRARAQPGARTRIDRDAWWVWLQQGLERAPFRPPAPADSVSAVRLLGLDDAMLRPWDLCVVAGADAGDFPAPREPVAGLSDAQAARFGLPDRTALRQHQLERIAALALCSRQLLLVESAPRAEHPGPSPVLQLWAWGLGLRRQRAAPLQLPLQALDPEHARMLAPIAAAAAATAADLGTRWSPSAYADLRACPYRYFARRVLGLAETDELWPDYSKRDFGVVLHAILERFHADAPPPAQQRERLDQLAAQHWQRAGALAEPFAAVWPAVRDHYLEWLGAWLQQGWQPQAQEQQLRRDLGDDGLQLEGRIDRIDRGQDRLFALDYKTSSADPLRARMQRWGEDTQLLAYGLLLGADAGSAVGAGYLVLDERAAPRGKSGYRLLEWPPDALAAQAAALAAQMQQDWQALCDGQRMRALGQPPLCDRCEAAVLCRRDHRLAFESTEPTR